MTRTVHACALAAMVIGHAAPARAQDAVISGVILADGTRTPIARARVTIAGPALDRQLVVLTDAEGRFTFDALPAGAFTLTASKPTFLSTAYGQLTPGRGTGVPISVTAGQRVADLVWTLPKGAVISGRVLDDGGQPFADIEVVLMQRVTRPGEATPRLVRASCCSGRTDGQGVFRLFGVPPGEYLVAALPRGDYVYMPEPWTTNPPAVREVTEEDVEWATRRLAGAPVTEPRASREVTYTRVFYGGTSQPDAASTLTLAAGEERTGIDIHMRLLPSASIEGRAIAPDGTVMRGIRVSMAGAGWGAVDTIVSRNLTPGRYTITVRDGAATLWGRADVNLAGEDVTDLEIRLAPAARLEGRIVFESSSAAAPPDLSSVRVQLRPLPGLWSQPHVSPDGTFTISGMDPGRYVLTASLPAGRGAAPARWVLKSAMLDGRDIADVAFDVSAGEQRSGIVVTFTDQTTELNGTLFDASGRPAPGFYVVVMPRDEQLRHAGSRRMPPPVRASTDGAFRFVGLPPGSYLLAAAASAEPDDLADEAFLKALAAASVDLVLGAGEKKVQHVRFAGGR